MSIPKPDLHLRLSPEADAVLELMATASEQTKTRMAESLLTEALLGRGHALKVAALRYARSGVDGKEWDRRR